MRLVSFSASNYRSITAAHRIAFSGVTVLIGKNNEGKSNLLRALQAAMSLLTRHSLPELRRSRLLYGEEEPYIWKRDFPVQLQERQRSLQTVLKLEFLLDDAEIQEFKEEIGSNLNGSLPLEIKIGKDNIPNIRLVKSGKGTKTLNQKSAVIAKFVASRIHFNYIPTIRTDSATIELIGNMLSQELRSLEKDPAYQAALDTIANLQKPILAELAERVQVPLKEFLPSINSVKIEISDSTRRIALRRDISVIVDDGTPTSIEHKGDGVKSLAALGLLKSQNEKGGASVLAIEEPEAHLHPSAIHQVNEIIQSIASRSQVILTTHNPLFVDRANIRSNIIVSDGSAVVAKSVAAIRDVLGVRASDNLTNANFALVVEGEEDAIALRALLPLLSDNLAKALRNHLIVVEPVGGAGNLSYKLSLLKSALCAVHVFLDGDEAGRQAFKRAEGDALLTLASCTFVNCRGMPEAEFEDCLDVALYKEAVLAQLGLDLSASTFRGSDKWSKRLKATLLAQGKPTDDGVLAKAKHIVANAVAKAPKIALNEHKRDSVDALVASLDRLVKA